MKEKIQIRVNGKELPVSTKHCVAICRAIKGKTLDEADNILENVLKMKRPIKMKGEIPHKKGRMAGGRYPVKAVGAFVKLMKNLRGNATAKDLDVEVVVIVEAKADKASTPMRTGRRSRMGKRTHVLLVGEENEGVKKKLEGKGRRDKLFTQEKKFNQKAAKNRAGEKKVEKAGEVSGKTDDAKKEKAGEKSKEVSDKKAEAKSAKSEEKKDEGEVSDKEADALPAKEKK